MKSPKGLTLRPWKSGHGFQYLADMIGDGRFPVFAFDAGVGSCKGIDDLVAFCFFSNEEPKNTEADGWRCISFRDLEAMYFAAKDLRMGGACEHA